MLQKQLGLSPSGKDRSKGCLQLIGVFLLVYAVQIWFVYERHEASRQYKDLGHGFTMKVADNTSILNGIPILGFWQLPVPLDVPLVISKDGVPIFSEDVFELPLDFEGARLWNIRGEAVVINPGNPPWNGHLGVPAPPDVPVWPVPTAAPDATNTTRQQQLVANIADETEKGSRSLSAINSRLIYRTPAIDRVVAEGPSIVPLLVATMEQADTDFDTFTRCYTACAQIRPEAKIHWSGGAFSAINVEGVTRFRDTSGYLDLEGFKKGVIVEIRAAFNLPMPPGQGPTVQGHQ